MKLVQKQGRAIYGVDMKIVDGDGQGAALGWQDLWRLDGARRRGLWSRYFKGEGSDPLVKDAQGLGWFPTGDVATIDADGFMQITDRSKDVIKSGGEWISSIDIENIAMGHPAVAMAACIGMPHPKWDERPIVAVTLKPGAQVTREELLAFYEGKTAKWQIPDDVVFVDAIPLGATGKMLKTKLREQLKDYRLPSLAVNALGTEQEQRTGAGQHADPSQGGPATALLVWGWGEATLLTGVRSQKASVMAVYGVNT